MPTEQSPKPPSLDSTGLSVVDERVISEHVACRPHHLDTDGDPLVQSSVLDSVQDTLKSVFGFPGFRSPQAEIVEAILADRDALVVMPTGGGKSLCYQLPALIREGVTLVVSPLIALMKDQVASLEKRGIAVTLINSTLTRDEQRDRLRRVGAGEYRLVYVAPERFRSPSFLASLRNVGVRFVAVDEAHCLSQWGHDFRPDYFRLGDAIEALGRPQVAAFTATATAEVRADIRERLRLREPAEFVAGFARPNLALRVRHVGNEAEKQEHLRALVGSQRNGIVYCATRKRVEQVAALLSRWKISHAAYHAGLGDDDRERAQERFISGEADVAVATNAFGMGIDRADIRFVVHYDVPGSVEAYYQEVGRAGRDGAPAVCELLFQPADMRIQEFFLEGANPPLAFIDSLWKLLCQQAGEGGELTLSARELAETLDSSGGEMAVSAGLSILERGGGIERVDVPGSRIRLIRILAGGRPLRELDIEPAALRLKAERDWAKWRRMTEFARERGCRQLAILGYFGEEGSEACGSCDNCAAPQRTQAREGDAREDEVVRKLLSGVARMCLRTEDGWQGRYGRARILQALQGSRSKGILDAGLQSLSTYGILKAEDPRYVEALLRELEHAGMVMTHPGRYPVVAITSKGADVMRGTAAYQLHWPKSVHRRTEPNPVKSPRPMAMDPLSAADGRLFEALRAIRSEFAQANGVPAYAVFPDETLRALARLRPRSPEAALRIRGVGETKARTYLPRMLVAIEEAAT